MKENSMIAFILLSWMLVYSSCDTPFGKSRYQGFENAIDIKHIKSLPGKKTKVLDINIPASGSMNFDYNKYLQKVYFVKLETTPESKIHAVDKILLTKDRIIVVDFNIAKAVYIFNSSGRFINSILAEKANAKAMIPVFHDVAYDYELDEIILHDQVKAKSYYFDKDGNFKSIAKEYIYFTNFANLGNTKYYVYLNSLGGNGHIPALSKSAIYIGNKDTRILYTATDAVKGMLTNVNYEINRNLSIINNNKNLFYTPEFSDTVYQISGEPINVYPKLAIHYPGANVNEILRKEHNKGISEFIKLKNTDKYYSFEGEVFCNDDSVYYIGSYKNGLISYFYSAKTNKIIGGTPVSKLLSTDSTQLDGYRYPITTFNSYFVSILSISDFFNTKWKSCAKLAEVKKDIKAGDNPILAFYKLKDF